MRLFVAVDLPEGVKDYLYELQSLIKDSKLAKVKWVSKKNLHLTMKFLGEIPENKLSELRDNLRNIKFKKFNLKLSKIGFYPNENKINVIWVGVEPENEVVKLQMLVDQETMSLGKFKSGAHITLGRVKHLKDIKLFKNRLNKIKITEISFEVGSFALFKSALSKDGPSYAVLEMYELSR